MDDTPTTLLVAEGDEPLREFLVDQFLADGFAASGAEGLEEARVRLASFHPDLLVLGELEGPREQLGLLRGDPRARLRRAADRAPELGRRGARPAARLRGGLRRLPRQAASPTRCCSPACGRSCAARRAASCRAGGSARSRSTQLARRATVAERPLHALADGVRPARPPGRRADAGVHQAGAAARRLGLPRRGQHPDGRRPRLPAAQEARARRRAAPGRERARRRLPAVRRRRSRRSTSTSSPRPRRATAVRRSGPLRRRKGLRRQGRLERRTPLRRFTPLRRTPVSPASEAQREKVAGRACLACGSQPPGRPGPPHAALARRLRRRALRRAALPRRCHRAFDRGELDLLAHLEPSYRAELAHALSHLSLLALLRRVTGTRWTPATSTQPNLRA